MSQKFLPPNNIPELLSVNTVTIRLLAEWRSGGECVGRRVETVFIQRK